MGRLTKFFSLTRSDQKFLCEAFLLLLLSNICVKMIAFKHLDRFLRRHWRGTIEGAIGQKEEITLVERSIPRAASVLPWESLCLSRSIAEFIMLRRRGIPAVMIMGVRMSENCSLDAHAWVETGFEANDVTHEHSDFAAVLRIGRQ